MRPNYVIKRDTFHCRWNRDLKPILHLKPGDTVRCEVSEVSGGQLNRKSTIEDYKILFDQEHYSRFYPLAGPIYVENVSPRDTLEVHILDMTVDSWGWAGFRPDLPPLNEIDDYYFHIWDLKNRRYANFKKGIKIPIRPFPGTIGVAPSEHGSIDIEPPYESNAGNMDIRYLTAGSKLLLPVLVNGALFSVGDPHAAQGDGELGTALESPAAITLRFEVLKGKKIPSAQYFARDDRRVDGDVYFGTTGSSADLMEAVRLAARHMIEYLVKEYDLTQNEAFMLCGLVADLRLHQVVNPPNWTVGLMIPQRVLEGKI
jgi:acetamidase/formamidase